MSTVLSNTTAAFYKGYNSNNASGSSAIFTQYRRHCFLITIPTSYFEEYSSNDIESAIFSFDQTEKHDYAVTMKSYWVFYNSTSSPFASGTTETVSTNASAYPSTASEQCVTSLKGSTSALNSFSVDITKLIKYAFDNVTPSESETTAFYIWQRFGISSPKKANGSSTNIGNWTLTVTMTDGTTLIFVYTNDEWKAATPHCRINNEWKQCAAQLFKDDTWQDI